MVSIKSRTKCIKRIFLTYQGCVKNLINGEALNNDEHLFFVWLVTLLIATYMQKEKIQNKDEQKLTD